MAEMSVAVPASWHLPNPTVHNGREEAASGQPSNIPGWHGYCSVAEGGERLSMREMTFCLYC